MRPDKTIIAISFVSSFFVLVSLFVTPRRRNIDFDNPSIQKPHKKNETFKISSVTFISIVFPLAIFLYCFRFMNLDIENETQFYTLFITNFIVVSAIVENLKNIVGRLRPDFIDRCKPIEGVCSGKLGMVNEGRKSFPSGHTATSTAGFLFLIIFLHIYYTRRPENGSKILKLLIILMLAIVPVSVGLSRFYDNRHFLSDIFSGGLIATGSTFFLYKFYGYRLLKTNSTH
ncbi:Lipid phosphate phosphatase 2 [Nosema granulosis]|uniref:Lipid phosphate phosphatase 2 n=1 Tax=Nosema granulosis TaxID=83296 RepID=A0A9P6H1K4_9MICR|nr:Lipid phosphate phosphatase 2 [Nosema granulosis]